MKIVSKAIASVTDVNIRNWFGNLKKYLEEENALDILHDPVGIYNADETGVQLYPKTRKVLGPKKFKNFYDIAIGQEKQLITVLNQFIVGRSHSGWMVGPIFLEYIANGFYQWLIENEIKFSVLFLTNGHKSHINPELTEFCVQKQILPYCLFPNATRILQPCDVGIFRFFKQAWRKRYQIYKQRSNRTSIKATFAPVFYKAFTDACKPNIIRNAFRCCGLYLFNVNKVDFFKYTNNRSREADLVVANISNNNTDSDRFLRTLENELSPATLKRYKLAAKLETEVKMINYLKFGINTGNSILQNQMKSALIQRKKQKKSKSKGEYNLQDLLSQLPKQWKQFYKGKDKEKKQLEGEQNNKNQQREINRKLKLERKKGMKTSKLDSNSECENMTDASEKESEKKHHNRKKSKHSETKTENEELSSPTR
ncbi:hypothetical protein ILUMI_16373 [Ignelater luminosus]|uniref:DDE-1 domain-containing protein n=1 Tax=Ignelater luminosus TaxID=2038154 RepID=A0A8K0G2Y8_IGNLU|nr:hypothetical protein ILUMI_16373 [Ignelater luminosus]